MNEADDETPTPCDYCDGSGDCPEMCGADYECEVCNGTGACPHCDGSGEK